MKIVADYVAFTIQAVDFDPADLQTVLEAEGIDHAEDGDTFSFRDVETLRRGIAVARDLGAEVERQTMGFDPLGKGLPTDLFNAYQDGEDPEVGSAIMQQMGDPETEVSRMLGMRGSADMADWMAAAMALAGLDPQVVLDWARGGKGIMKSVGPTQEKAMRKAGNVEYFSTYDEAVKVQEEVESREVFAGLTRIVEYDRGWAVQYYRSGPYYPELEDVSDDDVRSGSFYPEKSTGPTQEKAMNEDLNFYVNREGAKRGISCYLSDPNGDSARVSNAVKVLDRMPAGVFDLEHDPWSGAAILVRKGTTSDELIRFPDERQEAVSAEIRKFWGLAARYKELGMVHKRGLLVFGKPGTGKSCLLKRVSEEAAADDAIVLYCDDLYSVADGLKQLREVEPERKFLVVLEDIDAMGAEHTMLELFDGEKTVGGVLYLATTNYPERLDDRVTRPGRLDTKVEIGNPPLEGRVAYLAAKVPGIDPDEAVDLATAADDFSFAEMRELVVSVYALGADAVASIERIKGRSDGGPAVKSVSVFEVADQLTAVLNNLQKLEDGGEKASGDRYDMTDLLGVDDSEVYALDPDEQDDLLEIVNQLYDENGWSIDVALTKLREHSGSLSDYVAAARAGKNKRPEVDDARKAGDPQLVLNALFAAWENEDTTAWEDYSNREIQEVIDQRDSLDTPSVMVAKVEAFWAELQDFVDTGYRTKIPNDAGGDEESRRIPKPVMKDYANVEELLGAVADGSMSPEDALAALNDSMPSAEWRDYLNEVIHGGGHGQDLMQAAQAIFDADVQARTSGDDGGDDRKVGELTAAVAEMRQDGHARKGEYSVDGGRYIVDEQIAGEFVVITDGETGAEVALQGDDARQFLDEFEAANGFQQEIDVISPYFDKAGPKGGAGGEGAKVASVGWNVYLDGKLIDTVWFDADMEEDQVLRSLIDHDGYDPRIEVSTDDKSAKYGGAFGSTLDVPDWVSEGQVSMLELVLSGGADQLGDADLRAVEKIADRLDEEGLPLGGQIFDALEAAGKSRGIGEGKANGSILERALDLLGSFTDGGVDVQDAIRQLDDMTDETVWTEVLSGIIVGNYDADAQQAAREILDANDSMHGPHSSAADGKYQLPGADETEVGDALQRLDPMMGALLVSCVYEEGFEPDPQDVGALLDALDGVGAHGLANLIGDTYGMGQAASDEGGEDQKLKVPARALESGLGMADLALVMGAGYNTNTDASVFVGQLRDAGYSDSEIDDAANAAQVETDDEDFASYLDEVMGATARVSAAPSPTDRRKPLYRLSGEKADPFVESLRSAFADGESEDAVAEGLADVSDAAGQLDRYISDLYVEIEDEPQDKEFLSWLYRVRDALDAMAQ